MGLIRALKGAVGGAVRSTLSDTWLDYFVCDSIPSDVLMVKGRKKASGVNSENSGSDDIISKGSVIAVNEGQAMIVTDNGKIVDFTCEAGAYTFEQSSSPSLFAGDFGEGLTESFKEVVKRFGYGGGAGSSQRVYYINLKEIVGNTFASTTPMPYDDPFYKTVLYVDYNGVYSFKISDPVYFYAMIAGSVADSYRVWHLAAQIDTEFYSAIDSAMNKLAMENVKFSQLPSKQAELSRYMSQALSGDWKSKRGIEIVSVAINKITPDEKSRERIENFDNATMLGSNAAAMQGRMAGAQASVLENMGKSPSGVSGMDVMGVGLGMMGLNMINNNLAGQAQAPAPAAVAAVAAASVGEAVKTTPSGASWKCECGNVNTTPFCGLCGKRKKKYDVFLSYRREGGEAMAILLRDRLTEKGYKVFLDVESLNSGSFNTELLNIIEDSANFVTVLSKDALARCVNDGDWVRREISHALNLNKNIVPVILRGFDWPDDMPEDIAELANKNGISAKDNEYFDAAVERLTSFL